MSDSTLEFDHDDSSHETHHPQLDNCISVARLWLCLRESAMKQAMLMVYLIPFIGLPLGDALYCYKCVGTHPGCGEHFDWRWYWSHNCQDPDDKCVKIIEKKGAQTNIIRDCLSELKGVRRDIPGDRYEGCRPAAHDVQLGIYVFNDIKELDVKRNHYDEVTYCFCDFDERCNDSSSLSPSGKLMFLLIAAVYPLRRWLNS
ncbi:unnamed protein product [Darwinula stevensoni]|uniref:Protein quiver n=1 Tax=Darwinula stevensoni TaxID=69355 RepID=A0A7R8X1T9_9CRUS|nr:unnamed protein product [Darwinula stevensoni]CAG0880460.1 unnamed protein product [Darwinula stevensoni]